MDKFNELLAGEIKGVIEGLTGFVPEVTLTESNESDIKSLPSSAMVNLSTDGNGKMILFISISAATAVADLMMGGAGDAKESLNDDDLDATKEIISNIFGALTTTLSGQSDQPSLSFSIDDISEHNQEKVLDEYKKSYKFSFSVENATGEILILCDSDFLANFESEKDESANKSDETMDTEGFLTLSEMKNISLIMDVQLPVRVRIGTKTILLKDILKS